MLSPDDMEKAKLVQLGLKQFELNHLAVVSSDSNGNEIIICGSCGDDFPCERMFLFMLIQTISAFSAMMPSGNMGAILNRFSGAKK